MIGVFEDQNFVISFLAWGDLGIDGRTGYPKAALRIEVHLDRLCELRVFGEQIDFEAGLDFEDWLRLRPEWGLRFCRDW